MTVERLRRGRRLSLIATVAAAAVAVLATACGPAATRGGNAEDYPSQPIQLLVPAAPGGGWDQTARNLQQTVQDAQLTPQNVEVINREGGGGATGLAELTTRGEGNPHQLMVGGLVMIGALERANSPVSITDATTIATLTSESEAFVVRADSPFQTIQDVVTAYRTDPASVTFGGGSVGGSDHIAVGLLLQAAGLQPAGMKYIGYSGGGEATAGILAGDVGVGVSGVSEFEGQIASGEMRLLAISSTDEITVGGKPAPTLAQAGFDVDFVNWRALFAPPGLSEAQIAAVTSFVTKIHDTPQWKAVLERQGWTDDFRTGPEAAAFITEQQTQTATVLKELGL